MSVDFYYILDRSITVGQMQKIWQQSYYTGKFYFEHFVPHLSITKCLKIKECGVVHSRSFMQLCQCNVSEWDSTTAACKPLKFTFNDKG